MARHRWYLFGAAALAVVAVFGASVAFVAGPALFSGPAGDPQCRAARRIADAVRPLATGAMAAFETVPPADLSALPYDGTAEETRTLAALTGGVVLLNLWATWCPPCRAEMPSLAALHERLASEAFSVVAVSIDDKDRNRPQDFLAQAGATSLDYHREPTLTLFNSLRSVGLARGMPTTLLMGPDGCVAGALHGAAQWDAPEAERLISAAVAAAR